MYGIRETIQQIKSVVEIKGRDFTYEYDDNGNCVYKNEDGTPSCLVAQIAARTPYADEILPFLIEQEDAYAQRVLENYYTEDARKILNAAQSFQDWSFEYGKVLDDTVARFGLEDYVK